MSTFYVLPPRPALEDRLADCLGPLLPGLGWAPPRPGGGRLADLLLEALAPAGDVYLVCRDELPPGAAAEQALVDGFGAGAGDSVVEVFLGPRPGEVHSRRKVVGSQ